ncbi:hypothetical protein Taro_053496, partial [Colocasia esculenta]|nr:hypothetical protein [Colocasia esculenta]
HEEKLFCFPEGHPAICRTELGQALLGQERLLRWFSEQFGGLVVRSARSRREDVVWSGGDVVPCPVFAFFMEVLLVVACHVLARSCLWFLWWYLVVVVRLPCMGSLPVRLVAEAMGCLFSGLSGPAVWAHSTRWFTSCERDGGVRRIQVATALVVEFLLPLSWVVVCMRATCRTLDRHADVNKLGQALLGQRRLLWRFSRRFGGLVVRSARSHREDVVWSGGDAVPCLIFTFFMEVLPVVACHVLAQSCLWFPWWYLMVVDAAHSTSILVDFATLEIPEVVFLPPLHSLIMESAIGPLIFERFARVMGRISVQKGNSLAFHRFIYWEYHQGHIKSDVLAPLLSECERLSPSDWERHYPLTAQQLLDLNASQARSNQPPLSAAEFLDLNSIHLVRDPFDMWVERYKVYVSMKKELKRQQIFYPISIDQFLQHASFGTSSTYKMSLGKDEYGNFME